MARHLFLIMICLMAWQPCSGSEGHALLVAISDYNGTEFQSLDGPANDVALMRQVLVRRFGLSESHIRVISNEEASHSGLQREFSQLAERIAPGDRVYIHFSGHGSYTPDLNGDERSGRDQTWVSHGSRNAAPTKSSSDIDSYDVLDDEINTWLARLLEKSGELILVSDSCHSASVTRGDAPKVRGTSPDPRPHPLGTLPASAAPGSAILIGSARDTQSAAEFIADDGSHYGIFTWYWAEALEAAEPGDSWHDIFEQAAAKVRLVRGDSQRPQMEGDRRRLVFGGDVREQQRAVPVTRVQAQGSKVWLDSGSLAGMTVGSVFEAQRPDADDGAVARIRITRVHALESEAEVIAGRVDVGSLMNEKTHVFQFEPIKVFVMAEARNDEDRVIRERISELVESLPHYSEVDKQVDSDMVLYLARTQRGDARPAGTDPASTLPEYDEAGDAEVWVLSPVERLMHKDLRLFFSDVDLGMRNLRANLRKIARVKELRLLKSPAGGGNPVSLRLAVATPSETCSSGEGCFTVPGLGSYRFTDRFSADSVSSASEFEKGEILTYTLANTSSQGLYAYLIAISANGEISALFPVGGDREDVAYLDAGESLDTFAEGYGHILEVEGEEVVKLIFSREPVNISLLEQGGFTQRSGSALNPIEQLLTNATFGARGAVAIRNDSWGATELAFRIADDLTR